MKPDGFIQPSDSVMGTNKPSYGVTAGQDSPSVPISTNVNNSTTVVNHASTEYDYIRDLFSTENTITQEAGDKNVYKNIGTKLTGDDESKYGVINQPQCNDPVFPEDDNYSKYGVINQPQCNDPVFPENDNYSKYGVINQPQCNDPVFPEDDNYSKYGVINQPQCNDPVFPEDDNYSKYGVINQPQCDDPVFPEDDNNQGSDVTIDPYNTASMGYLKSTVMK